MRVHLKSLATPLTISGSLQADCGKQIREPRLVAMFDEVGMGQKLKLSVKGLCKDCAEVERSARYTYGVCESKEFKREEDLYV